MTKSKKFSKGLEMFIYSCYNEMGGLYIERLFENIFKKSLLKCIDIFIILVHNYINK